MNEFITIFRDLKYMAHWANKFILDERIEGNVCNESKESRAIRIQTLMTQAISDLISAISKEVVEESPTGKEVLNEDFKNDALIDSLFVEREWEYGGNQIIYSRDFKPQYYKAWKEIDELCMKYGELLMEDRKKEKENAR